LVVSTARPRKKKERGRWHTGRSKKSWDGANKVKSRTWPTRKGRMKRKENEPKKDSGKHLGRAKRAGKDVWGKTAACTGGG